MFGRFVLGDFLPISFVPTGDPVSIQRQGALRHVLHNGEGKLGQLEVGLVHEQRIDGLGKVVGHGDCGNGLGLLDVLLRFGLHETSSMAHQASRDRAQIRQAREGRARLFATAVTHKSSWTRKQKKGKQGQEGCCRPAAHTAPLSLDCTRPAGPHRLGRHLPHARRPVHGHPRPVAHITAALHVSAAGYLLQNVRHVWHLDLCLPAHLFQVIPQQKVLRGQPLHKHVQVCVLLCQDPAGRLKVLHLLLFSNAGEVRILPILSHAQLTPLLFLLLR